VATAAATAKVNRVRSMSGRAGRGQRGRFTIPPG
jgi:hypothetical protein